MSTGIGEVVTLSRDLQGKLWENAIKTVSPEARAMLYAHESLELYTNTLSPQSLVFPRAQVIEELIVIMAEAIALLKTQGEEVGSNPSH